MHSFFHLLTAYSKGLTLSVMLLIFAAVAPSAYAGLGPDNIIVVVNEDSWASKALANEFIHLRNIPADNVIYLSGLNDLDLEDVSVDEFRQRLLGPVIEEIRLRGLTNQIDCVAWSSDFPFRVSITQDAQGHDLPRQITHSASINGLTFLHRWVLQRDVNYLRLDSNFYAARPLPAEAFARRSSTQPDQDVPPVKVDPPRPFSASKAYAAQVEADGQSREQQYLLSCVLGITSGRGNSLTEAIQSLRRARNADASKPVGGVYFMVNDDIRSRTRQWGFPAAIKHLATLDIHAEAIEGLLPQDKDVIGVTSGSPELDWHGSASRLLPGAIFDNMTSAGGVMRVRGSQTPISEYIRHGATAASGTVGEPYALQAKFPTALLHYYYAAGCTMIESFYQAVQAPYQLMILGDPMCRPWASTAEIILSGIQPYDIVSGSIILAPEAIFSDSSPAARFDVFVDGRQVAFCPAGETVGLNSTALSEGYHELRLAAVAGDGIESQSHLSIPFFVNNLGLPPLSLSCETLIGASTVRINEPLIISASMPGATRITLHHHGRQLAVISAESGTATIDPHILGLGQTRIFARAELLAGGTIAAVQSAPLSVFVLPPTPLPALSEPPAEPLTPGIKLITPDGRQYTIADLSDQERLANPELASQDGQYLLEGFLSVPADNVYQFQVKALGHVVLWLDNQPLDLPGDNLWHFLPVSLAEGVHMFRAAYDGASITELDIRFGGPGAWPIGTRNFSHAGPAMPLPESAPAE